LPRRNDNRHPQSIRTNKTGSSATAINFQRTDTTDKVTFEDGIKKS